MDGMIMYLDGVINSPFFGNDEYDFLEAEISEGIVRSKINALKDTDPEAAEAMQRDLEKVLKGH